MIMMKALIMNIMRAIIIVKIMKIMIRMPAIDMKIT
jgi:hypothetical protein